jgi:hypothetical protein
MDVLTFTALFLSLSLELFTDCFFMRNFLYDFFYLHLLAKNILQKLEIVLQ